MTMAEELAAKAAGLKKVEGGPSGKPAGAPKTLAEQLAEAQSKLKKVGATPTAPAAPKKPAQLSFAE